MTIKKRLKHLWRGFFHSEAILDIISILALLYTKLVGKSSKFKVNGLSEFEEMVTKYDGGIFVTWHGRALMLPFFWRNVRLMKALVSPHNDGRIIANILKGYNILSIDGSSDKNAGGAAFCIINELKKGTVVSLISDGPRGPAQRLHKSVIYFAQKTKKPIMGFTYSAKGAKVCRKSWDDMLIPLPFSEGVVYATKPLFVPENISDEEAERLRKEFEDELNTLTAKADAEYGIKGITPGRKKTNKHERPKPARQ